MHQKADKSASGATDARKRNFDSNLLLTLLVDRRLPRLGLFAGIGLELVRTVYDGTRIATNILDSLDTTSVRLQLSPVCPLLRFHLALELGGHLIYVLWHG